MIGRAFRSDYADIILALVFATLVGGGTQYGLDRIDALGWVVVVVSRGCYLVAFIGTIAMTGGVRHRRRIAELERREP